MGFWKTAVSGGAGIVIGLVVGYTVWGQSVAELHAALAKVSAELATTKAWLWDEIRTSDERHDRVSSTLTKTLADLTNARAELERIRAASGVSADVPPSALPAHASPRRTGDAAASEPPHAAPRGVPSRSPTNGSR
jgi:hypothetical protein